jgi:hypothetical protein
MEDSFNPIYTIMVFEKCEKDKYDLADVGCSKVVGFKHKLETAIDTVINNVCDICENCYMYALVEEVLPCLYPCNDKRWYFKFNTETKKYEQT